MDIVRMYVIWELRYRSYRAQREAHPEIEPEKWEKVFGRQAAEFEERYKGEKEAIAAAEWLEIGPPWDDPYYEGEE